MLVPSEKEREQLLVDGLELWRLHSVTYRTLIIEHLFLVAEKRRLKLYPLRPVSKSIIDDYPVVQLFYFLTESEAREFLEKLVMSDLRYIVTQAQNAVEYNHSYRTLVANVIDARRVLMNYYSRKRYAHRLGGDPEDILSDLFGGRVGRSSRLI